MNPTSQLELFGLDLGELNKLAKDAGQAVFRGQQLFDALYRQRTQDLEQISTLPAAFRHSLAQQFSLGLPTIERTFVSQDGTVRYLMAFSDGQSVETVWMPDGDGGEAGDGSEAGTASMNTDDPRAGTGQPIRAWNRATICVSSQVGCAVDCQFCLTALLGVKRNLSAGEIAGQVCAVLNQHQVFPPHDRVNLVFMGMGEPFLNYDNFIKAVRLLAEGVGIPESRMTVSTAGIVPRIADLGKEAIRPKLAISLNAPNDELRSRIMPLNRKWNLEKLIGAAREFPLRAREKLTFEYVLLDGVNDQPEHAHQMIALIRGIRAKVNLIAFNPGPGIDFRTPAGDRVLDFQKTLMASGIPAFIRRPRGRDIYAACGQLKKTVG